jgi:rod shape-determining protein MreD
VTAARAVDAAKSGALLFVAALVQVSIVSPVSLFGGSPDLLLVALVAVALLRGSLYGSIGGFFAGLVVDTANLGTLGLTSLLLSFAGYWIGRYGETTGRDRVHAPFLSVAVVTVLYAIGGLVLHFVLGDHVSASRVIVHALLPSMVLNVLLTAPVHALCRRIVRPPEWGDRAVEVRLLG